MEMSPSLDDHFLWLIENGMPIPKQWHESLKETKRDFISDFNLRSKHMAKQSVVINSPFWSDLFRRHEDKDQSVCLLKDYTGYQITESKTARGTAHKPDFMKMTKAQ